MKLQNLTIIFIIIIIPIVLIFTLYLNLETKTILLQTSYDEKLIEATKEAVEALEINTTEWTNEKYAQLANQKRDNIQSSINTFITSLSNKFGITGTSEELILNYVPAIVYVMYDGYYIYSPTYVPKTVNEEDKFSTDGEKTYKHVLKTFVPYSREYTANGKTYVINYTLDNYIRIYGEEILKEGYIIDDFGNTNKISFTSDIIPQVKFNNIEIKPEILSENITVRDNYSSDVDIKSYPYIYYRTGENSGDSGNVGTSVNKAYYDEVKDEFFIVSDSYVKVYLGKDGEVGSKNAKYKKILVCTDNITGEYIELHQLINGNDPNWYYIDSSRQYVKYEKSDEINARIEKYEDCSAINYYIENYEFNKWLRLSSGLNLDEAQIKELLDSKNEVIINNINNNLYLSMKNYSANSKNNYELPEITAVDWEQALSNISMIAFLQGNKIGLKTYNNYTVVSSTYNNEYVNDETLYYASNQDYYYHTQNCNQISSNDGSVIDGVYKNTEFKVQRYSYKLNDENKSGYYYRHSAENGSKTMAQCFNCIVNRNKFVKNDDLDDAYLEAYYNAIARERYVQMSRISLNIEPYKNVTNIQFNQTELWIPVESYGSVSNSVFITPTLLPSNSTNKSLIWSSDNNNIATVNANGKVTAKNPGKVRITATSKNDSNINASIDIYVYNAVYTWTEERQLLGRNGEELSIKFPIGPDYLILDNTSNNIPTPDNPTGSSYYCIKYSKNHPKFNHIEPNKYYFRTYHLNGENLCHTFFAVTHDGKEDIALGGSL